MILQGCAFDLPSFPQGESKKWWRVLQQSYGFIVFIKLDHNLYQPRCLLESSKLCSPQVKTFLLKLYKGVLSLAEGLEARTHFACLK